MSEVPAIDVHELATRVEAGATVIDVREVDEYEEAHVPGAILVPLSELAERVEDVPDDRALLVICKMGGRSARACEFLAPLGRDVTNVLGGTQGWIDAGYDVNTGTQP